MFDMFGFFLDLLTGLSIQSEWDILSLQSQGIKIDFYDFRKAGA